MTLLLLLRQPLAEEEEIIVVPPEPPGQPIQLDVVNIVVGPCRVEDQPPHMVKFPVGNWK